MNDTHGRDDLIILMAHSVVCFIVQARPGLWSTVLSQAMRMSRAFHKFVWYGRPARQFTRKMRVPQSNYTCISQICAHDCFCNQCLCEGVDIYATIRQPSYT